MRTAIVEGPAELERRFEEVADLFRACFEEDLEREQWEQYYLAPPRGASVGIFGYEETRPVGFYGLVPQYLECVESERTVPYLLGCGLMVRPEQRQAGRFLALVDAAHSAVAERDAEFLLGFPNETSHRPLTRLCGWTLLQETPLYAVPVPPSDRVEPLPDRRAIERLAPSRGCGLPYSDPEYLSWRSGGAGYEFLEFPGRAQLAYKVYQDDTLDVMDVVALADDPDGRGLLTGLAASEGCSRVAVTGAHADVLGFRPSPSADERVQTVRMAGRGVDGSSADIRLSLFLSDVF